MPRLSLFRQLPCGSPSRTSNWRSQSRSSSTSAFNFSFVFYQDIRLQSRPRPFAPCYLAPPHTYSTLTLRHWAATSADVLQPLDGESRCARLSILSIGTGTWTCAYCFTDPNSAHWTLRIARAPLRFRKIPYRINVFMLHTGRLEYVLRGCSGRQRDPLTGPF